MLKMLCIKCGSDLMKPSGMKEENFVGLVCGDEKCDRFGLITVVGKKVEQEIILPKTE